MSFTTLVDPVFRLIRSALIPKTGCRREPLYVIAGPSEKQKRAFELVGTKVK